MTVKLLTKQHLEFLSLKGNCTGSSESTLVKMPQCWKSHVTAQFYRVPDGQAVTNTLNKGNVTEKPKVLTSCIMLSHRFSNLGVVIEQN